MSLLAYLRYLMHASTTPILWSTFNKCCMYHNLTNLNFSVELRKEMKMRFLIAYAITFAVYAGIFWYIIKFTAAFGWRQSWIWWYTCVFAILIQIFGVDFGVAFLQWIVHWCSRNLSLFWMKIRMVKMCRQEA